MAADVPAVEITVVKEGIKFVLKGEQPIKFGNGNIMFPSHWTEEQVKKWNGR